MQYALQVFGEVLLVIEILTEVEMIDTMKNDIGTNCTEMNDILVTVIGEIDIGMNDTQMIDIGIRLLRIVCINNKVLLY